MNSYHKRNRLSERLRISSFKLESLLEITKAINHNLPKEKLFMLYSDILRKQLRIGKLCFFLHNGKTWEIAVRYGWRAKRINFSIEEMLNIKEITTVTRNKKFYPFDIVIPVFHKNTPLAYVLIADFDEEHLQISPTIKHLPFIQTLSNIISVAIENKRLAKENARKMALEKDLSLAREVQQMLFPHNLDIHPDLEVAAHYIPHYQIGGDYYDFFKIDEQRYAMCIADVSGKGVSAALLMANFQANLHALIKQSFSLADLISSLNKKVVEASRGERFITFFIGIYNMATHKLNYINAGHPAPLFFSKGKIYYLKEGTTGLGMLDELPFLFEGNITCHSQDLLYLYTDGVTEYAMSSESSAGETFLENFLKKNYSFSVNKINSRLLQYLKRLSGEAPYTDDFTLLGIRFL